MNDHHVTQPGTNTKGNGYNDTDVQPTSGQPPLGTETAELQRTPRARAPRIRIGSGTSFRPYLAHTHTHTFLTVVVQGPRACAAGEDEEDHGQARKEEPLQNTWWC